MAVTSPDGMNPAYGHGTGRSALKRVATDQLGAVAGVPAFVVTIHDTQTMFGIDDDAFSAWVESEGDELGGKLPDPSDDCVGSSLSDLVYGALSAGALIGDPRIELNVHSDGVGYLVRLNNVAGRQQLVGLTRGWNAIHWPPNNFTSSGKARFYLQEICDVVNMLLEGLSEARFANCVTVGAHMSHANASEETINEDDF